MTDTNQKKTKKRVYDKTRNRFMSLRYNSDTDEYASVNANDIADEFGFSKSTISNIEDPTIDEDTILGKSARLFKAYHDKFGCSYEYLFGEASLPDPKYANLDSSPLASLDSLSINNLEKLLSDNEFAAFNSYMLKAIMTEPKALQDILNILFRFMYVINSIYSDKSLNNAEKELKASNYWFSLNSNLDTFLKDSLLPHLKVGFDMFEQKEKERDMIAVSQIEEDLVLYESEMSSPISVKVIDNGDKNTSKQKKKR